MKASLPTRLGSVCPQSNRMRLMAILCLLLVCVASTAQVCHTHPDLFPLQKDSQKNTPAPDHCPLCVAMHSALPVAAHGAPEPVLQVQPVFSGSAQMLRIGLWSFELFSRPPPPLPSRA